MSDLRNATLCSLVDRSDYVDHQLNSPASPPKIASNGDWDTWTIGYLLVEIHRLNTVLKSKIPDAGQRQSIVVDYFHGFVDLLEMGAIKRPDVPELPVVFPQLAFAEKAYNPDDQIGAATRIHLAPTVAPWEDYVGGLIADYFSDMNESLPAEMILHSE
jgi:hypothetical protein